MNSIKFKFSYGMFFTFFILFLSFLGTGIIVKAEDEPPASDSKENADKAATETVTEDTEWDDVSVELLGVKRASGDTLTIKFKYTNNGSEEIDISRAGQFGHDNIIEHVYFVDTKNNKKYLIVKDSEGKPLGTMLQYFALAPGASKSAWAKFPAPPTDVETITVYLPGSPPFEDVAIVK
jgi:hypothetical protein